MEVFETILGLVAIYAWVHSTVIIFNKIKKITGYEQVVLWLGFVFFILYVLGTYNQ